MMLMETTIIKDLYRATKSFENQEIKIEGWVRTVRDSKTFGFIEINDGSFFNNVQVVFNDNLTNFEEICKLTIGSSIAVTGKVVLTPDAKQPFEIQATSVTIDNLSSQDYPLQKKRHTFEYLRTVAHLRPRTNTFNAIFRIRSVAAFAIHEYFQNNGYVYLNSPIITCADCEGSAEMFKLTTLDLDNPLPQKDGHTDFTQDIFGKKAFITGSGQLHGETFAHAFGKIYTFGPTLRSENSNTKTHANEFWMVEPEICFCDLEQLMNIEEDFLKYVVKVVLEKCPEELEFCDKFIENGLIEKLQKVLNSSFTRLDHKEAIDILKKEISALQRKIKTMPEGLFVCYKYKNNTKWYQELKDSSGKVTRKYIPKAEKALAKKLARLFRNRINFEIFTVLVSGAYREILSRH